MHKIECQVHPTAQWVSSSTNQLMYTEVNARSRSISLNSCASLCKPVIRCSCFFSCVLMTLGKSLFSGSCLFICVLRTLGNFVIVCFFILGTSFVFGSDLSLGLIFILVMLAVLLFSFALHLHLLYAANAAVAAANAAAAAAAGSGIASSLSASGGKSSAWNCFTSDAGAAFAAASAASSAASAAAALDLCGLPRHLPKWGAIIADGTERWAKCYGSWSCYSIAVGCARACNLHELHGQHVLFKGDSELCKPCKDLSSYGWNFQRGNENYSSRWSSSKEK